MEHKVYVGYREFRSCTEMSEQTINSFLFLAWCGNIQTINMLLGLFHRHLFPVASRQHFWGSLLPLLLFASPWRVLFFSVYEQGNACQIALASPGNCVPLKGMGKCFSVVRLAHNAHLFSWPNSSNLPSLHCKPHNLLLAVGPDPAGESVWPVSCDSWCLGWRGEELVFKGPHSFSMPSNC